MPLYKGNTKVGAIYKGTTQYGKVYKGSTLVFESAKWLPYYYEYLYNDLVPTTIDSKNVKDKAKVATIYGNSVVENQLFTNFLASTTVNGITFTNNQDGSFTVSGTATAGGSINWVCYTTNINLNHRILISGLFKKGSSTTYYTNFPYIGSFYVENVIPNTQNTIAGYFNLNVRFESGAVINETIRPQFIDLTQMFPFDTPTTLTDNRVQALLNRGYIPYNTGEIKSVDIGEIESEGYNLFDGIFKQGSPTGSQDNIISSLNNIEVLGGLSYTLEGTLPSKVGVRTIIQYDIDLNQLSSTLLSNTNTVDLRQNTRYIKIQFNARSGQTLTPSEVSEVCFHRTGTRTGYAPYVAPQTLQLKYQGSGVGTAHDTMEIGKENVVFTKNNTLLDLWQANWVQESNLGFYTTTYNTLIKSSTQNFMITTSKYFKGGASWNVQNTMWVGASSAIGIADRDYSTSQDFTNYLSTNKIQMICELATPQVITIPRKHLGVIDLGSLNWNYSSQRNIFEFYNYQNVFPHFATTDHSAIGNAYCCLYKTESRDTIRDNLNLNNVISIHTSDTDYINIRDTRFTNASDFKAAMAGQYLYYETQDEVADMIDTIGVQAGGTLSTDSEVLPNVTFNMKCK